MTNKLVPHTHPSHGLTLVELVVTVAVLAVLLSISIPSFTPSVERWRTNQAISEIESALFYARSEGIRHGGNLSLSRITSSSNCTSAANEWQCGWQLIFDTNQDGQPDAGTMLIKTNSSFTKMVITASAIGNTITIDRWGNLSLSNSGNSFNFIAHPPSKPNSDYTKLCIKSGTHLQKIKASDDC